MDANRLNIYSPRRNHRFNYIIGELFERRMGLSVDVFTDVDLFLQQEGVKLNYSDRNMEGLPQIIPAKILFEKRIQEQDLDISTQDIFKIYYTKGNELGFDPLAASFYLLSMYEDYLPHREDEHGMAVQAESLVVSNQVHHIPLVDRYALLLNNWLKKFYPHLPDLDKSIHLSVTIDVDQLFAVKAKGLARSILGILIDTLRGKLFSRIAILSGRTPDPNEIYDELIALCRARNVPLTFFFQVGDNSRFDINNPPHLNEVKQRVNEIALSAEVGLHPSYFSSDDQEKLESEVDRLRSILTTPVTKSRQHFLRYKLPKTFRELSELGIKDDYSVGFTECNGFRASTCRPFRLFDLERDEITSITIHPMASMDTCSVKLYHSSENALKEMIQLKKAIQEVGGEMITTWHPEILTGQRGAWSSFKLLEQFLEHE
jgi:hypothetical protein